MTEPARRLATLVAFAVLTAGLVACSTSSNGSGGANSTVSSAAVSGGSAPATGANGLQAECAPATLKTRAANVLTFATDQPVYEPWFVNNDPTSGNGFESAVAYAVAAKLGYQKSAVKWTRVTFNAAIAPGPKQFDADIDEFSITDARKKAVDFSTGYYDVTQTVIALKGSKAAAAKSIADLKGLKLGAQVGTTSYSAITEVIKPSKSPAVYNSNDDAKTALKNKQIDGLVLDLPTAFYVTGAELDNGVIVGQLPVGANPEQFGIVLNKDSALTSCVSAAVDALRAAGTLKQLAQKWLTQTGNAPELS